MIKEKTVKNTRQILDMATNQKVSPRVAAEKMAKQRVLKAME